MGCPEMLALIRQLVKHDGISETLLPEVFLFSSHKPQPRVPLMYQPSLCIIAQGRKIGYLGDREIHYDEGHYLVQTLPLPFECETFASEETPLFGISVSINAATLAELVLALAGPQSKEGNAELPKPMDSVAMTIGMEEAVIRLLRALHDLQAARVVGSNRVRDVIFEALQGAQGPALKALVQNQGHYSRIVQVLTQMHSELADEISVEQLARRANMSLSTFHHHFKQVTRSSPIQYLKRLRLIKAQLLLSHDELNVTQTASAVGYKSVNQFSRDYKRYFGVSPKQYYSIV
ncbi:AraC family transcriptional regulator [Zooshikella ganghwensis]|uniref:AraC family transcriptional regulator n=1 Tax=Zooshikella ganghwensis TaxID=202772 RepID=A0A4P9VQ70_9GAMM|nr:AraC family transcriptional regulator [Zooshikella ganghwensis]RDH45665.1 AraC family transcriptional regulator [Zooshikella ganghwensis]